jgi:hypothetical protein
MLIADTKLTSNPRARSARIWDKMASNPASRSFAGTRSSMTKARRAAAAARVGDCKLSSANASLPQRRVSPWRMRRASPPSLGAFFQQALHLIREDLERPGALDIRGHAIYG